MTNKTQNSSNRLNYLNSLIVEWAENKGILGHNNPMAQAIKTQEECTELLKAVLHNDKPEISDAIGDIYVTILIQAELQGINITEAIEKVYSIISKRTGSMKNGMFVKDE